MIEKYRGVVWVDGDDLEELLQDGIIKGPFSKVVIEKNDLLLRGTSIERTVIAAVKLAKEKGYPLIRCVHGVWEPENSVARYTYEFYDLV